MILVLFCLFLGTSERGCEVQCEGDPRETDRRNAKEGSAVMWKIDREIGYCGWGRTCDRAEEIGKKEIEVRWDVKSLLR